MEWLSTDMGSTVVGTGFTDGEGIRNSVIGMLNSVSLQHSCELNRQFYRIQLYRRQDLG